MHLERTRGWLERGEVARGAALAGAAGVVVAGLASGLDEPPAEVASRALAFWALSVPPLLLALPGWLRAARRAADFRAARWLFAAALFAVLVPDRLVRGSPDQLVGIAVYAAAALLLSLDRPRVAGPLPRDLLLVAALWLPLELRWVTGDFVLLRLFGLDLLLLLYAVERPLCEPGRLLPSRRAELAWGVGAWLAFLPLAVPIAVASGFARPGLSQRSAAEWALFVVLTFWVVALPEEALFRGAIQGLLARALGRRWVALAAASVVFGLSHLNNRNGDPPDWRYVLLASLAGAVYGMAYLRTGNLAAPTLTHFLVDVTWRGFFAGGR